VKNKILFTSKLTVLEYCVVFKACCCTGDKALHILKLGACEGGAVPLDKEATIFLGYNPSLSATFSLGMLPMPEK
jgi:hypothetical protein